MIEIIMRLTGHLFEYSKGRHIVSEESSADLIFGHLVYQLILGCHHQRYSRARAIDTLSQSFDMIFANVLRLKQSNQRELR